MRAYLTLALILSVGLQVHAAEPPAPVVADAEAKASLWQEAFLRSVRDLATWDFALLTPNSHWVIAQVTSAGPTYKLSKEELEGRKPNEPDVRVRKYYTTVYEGSVQVLTPLGTAPQKTLWPYHYEQRRLEVGNEYKFIRLDPFGSEGHEQFSPFRHEPVNGATQNLALLYLPESIQNVETPSNAAKTNSPQFRPVFISEESAKWVVPTQTFYKANLKLFSPEKAAANRTRLLELLDNENPFLFAAAVRTLAQSGELGDDYISAKLLNADRFRQSVFVYSTLLYSPEAAGKIAVEQMQAAIEKAQNSAQLEGMISGVSCSNQTLNDRIFHAPWYLPGKRIRYFIYPVPNLPPEPPSLKFNWSLRSALDKKQQALDAAAGITRRPPKIQIFPSD